MVTYLEHFQHRVLQDALAEASAAYWRRRAADLRAARPDPSSDFCGTASKAAQRKRWRELTEAAAACENRAALLERHGAEMFAEDLSTAVQSLEVVVA